MIVDTKLDDENKENCSFQSNLENTNNNVLGEDETLRNVEIVGTKVEKIVNESQKESDAINSNILETTTSSLTSSCLSEEKIEVIENQTESSIKCIQFETIAEEPYLTAKENYNITRNDEEKQEPDTLKDENKIEGNAEECSEINISEHIHCLNKDGINDSKQNEVTFLEAHSQSITNTSEEIVSIIKRSPSDASDGNRKNILKHENSDAIDQFSDASQSSPNQKNHKSSTQHRVKFTEELPTKSTLQYNPALTSSPSQSSSSRMGGTSTGETTPNKHPGEQSHGQVKLGSEAQEFSEELPPQVMISGEEFPSKEANPFGTKIDSSYEGWDNPFRPEGEISHDAEELLRLWRLGKLDDQSRKNSQSCNNNDKIVTPKGTPKHTNGKVANSNNTDDASEPLLAQNGSHKNGVSSATASTTNTSSTFEVKRETVGVNQQPQHSQPVTINDKTRGDVTDSPKKKTDGCCSIM